MQTFLLIRACDSDWWTNGRLIRWRWINMYKCIYKFWKFHKISISFCRVTNFLKIRHIFLRQEPVNTNGTE